MHQKNNHLDMRHILLIIASLLFGIAHAVTYTYALAAAVIGVYLGVLWWLAGNLLAPVACHAVYDFVALWYYLRVWSPAQAE